MRRALTVAVFLLVSCASGASPLRAEDGTIAQTEAYYLHGLSGMGGARKMVATNDRKTVVVFYTQGNSRLVYKTTSDLGNTWCEKPVVVGPSLAGGVAAWIDEQDNIYLAYCDQRNTFCFRKLTYKGDATWELGEPGNGGKSLAGFRAYYHSAICKEPGKDSPVWACWWEHGRDGDKTGTVKRLRVSHSTDPDGRNPWSASVDPVPANVALNENEGNTVTMLLAGGKPAVFVYQPATWGFKSGLCIYDGKEWSWHEVDTKPTAKTTAFPQAGYAVAADAKGVVHFVWNAQAETGSIFYRKFEDGKWSPVETLSSCPFDRFPTITVDGFGWPAALWCHPVKEDALKETKVSEPKANYNIVYKKCGGGKWDADETTLVKDEKMQDGTTNLYPNTCLASGDAVLVTYQYGKTESGGFKRLLKSATIK